MRDFPQMPIRVGEVSAVPTPTRILPLIDNFSTRLLGLGLNGVNFLWTSGIMGNCYA